MSSADLIIPIKVLLVDDHTLFRSGIKALLQRQRAGAQGYLLKNIEADYLLDAIRRVVGGESVMSPQMTAKLMQNLRTEPKPLASVRADHDKLSPREREILGFLTKGVSNKEIARALTLAESTVKIHIQGILKKLNMTSRVQAAVYATEHGLTQKG
ncbi:MAG: response regulator transcription factor [Rhodocyclaceae bacterium]|nr:response regulator transcription factor [Rhodocyclaceae bacterium]